MVSNRRTSPNVASPLAKRSGVIVPLIAPEMETTTTISTLRGVPSRAAAALLSLVAVATAASVISWIQPAEISQPAGQCYESGLGEQRSIAKP